MGQKIPIQDYLTSEKPTPVFRLRVRPNFSPIDINLQFIMEEGWTNADRLRFHVQRKLEKTKNPVMNSLLRSLKPHLLIRHYDKNEDAFMSIHINLDGQFDIFSNDENFAQKYLHGLFLEFPPSFHSIDDLEVAKEWIADPRTCAFFLGLLQGSLGWDSFNQIPSSIKLSLEEAEKALEISNYRSCVVMCRRTVEALLKFAHQRLLNAPPVDGQGRALSFDAMIKQFRQKQPPPIPAHLLHILDSIRVIGNVPGAHPVEIEGYKFSRIDAEFTLVSVKYFIDQYFSQIDQEVTKYYTLSINLNEVS